jgi:hypothetical protein
MTGIWSEARFWSSDQSGGLARRRSTFDPRQGWPLYIWMYTTALWVCFGEDIALYKYLYLLYLFINEETQNSA